MLEIGKLIEEFRAEVRASKEFRNVVREKMELELFALAKLPFPSTIHLRIEAVLEKCKKRE